MWWRTARPSPQVSGCPRGRLQHAVPADSTPTTSPAGDGWPGVVGSHCRDVFGEKSRDAGERSANEGLWRSCERIRHGKKRWVGLLATSAKASARARPAEILAVRPVLNDSHIILGLEIALHASFAPILKACGLDLKMPSKIIKINTDMTILLHSLFRRQTIRTEYRGFSFKGNNADSYYDEFFFIIHFFRGFLIIQLLRRVVTVNRTSHLYQNGMLFFLANSFFFSEKSLTHQV